MTGLSALMRLARDEGGSAAAEMVLILPVATFMLLVTLEAGHFMVKEHEVMKSVRDAARWGARQPMASFGCTAAAGETALTGAMRDNVATLARYGQLDTDAPLRVAGWTDAQVSVSYSCLDITTVATGNGGLYSAQKFAPRITVVATPNYPTLFGSAAGFLGTLKLFAKQQAVVAGT